MTVDFNEVLRRAASLSMSDEEAKADLARAERARLETKLAESEIVSVITERDRQALLNGTLMLTHALRVATDWFDGAKAGDGPQILVLLGRQGRGKTVAAGSLLIRNHGFGLYKTLESLCLQRTQRTRKYSDDFDRALKASFLLIDDAGAEYDLETSKAVIQEAINCRQGKGFLTAITANLTRDEFRERYDERTWSRLLQLGHIVQVTGPDLRDKAVQKVRKAS